MSGLCGCIHHAGQPAHTETVREMADAASHRAWSGAHASLGHLALNVTSEDKRESQPLVEGPLVLVADARIDDRATLQSKVRSKLRPSSPTDADLILAACRWWGRTVLSIYSATLPSPSRIRVSSGCSPLAIGPDGIGSFCDEDRLLQVLYFPDRTEGASIEIEPVSATNALQAVLRHSFLPWLVEATSWQSDRLAALARLVERASVRRLTYP